MLASSNAAKMQLSEETKVSLFLDTRKHLLTPSKERITKVIDISRVAIQ